MTRRRGMEQLQQPPQTCHAGLWLDRFLGSDPIADKTKVKTDVDKTKAKTELVKQVARIKEPPEYALFYKRWLDILKHTPVQTRVASVQGRMIVGLGAESVLETAVSLQRTYGVPIIPGSALKGVAAAYARQKLVDWQPRTINTAPLSNYDVVFGNPDSAGYVTFFDALYIPNSAAQPLVVDVMTPHHSGYLDGKVAPTDFDAPIPVQFLSATGEYVLALGGDPGWVNITFLLLERALAEYGVGAKTSSGYGRLKLEAAPLDPDQEAVDFLLADIARLRDQDVATRLDSLFKRWQQLAVGRAHKQQVARALVEKVKAAGRQTQSQEKSWYRELLQWLPT